MNAPTESEKYRRLASGVVDLFIEQHPYRSREQLLRVFEAVLPPPRPLTADQERAIEAAMSAADLLGRPTRRKSGPRGEEAQA